MKIARTILTGLMSVCLFYLPGTLFAAPQSIDLSKGQVVDFLFLTHKEDITELRKQYFRDIYPPAKELGYNPAAGFRITQPPISGYYSPNVMAIGTWPGDWEQRQQHFQNLETATPDIRARRLAIWSTFNMMNFEVEKDIKVSFDPSKNYVFGAYWLNEGVNTGDYQTAVIAAIRQAGGEVELLTNNVKTMFGYAQAPALAMITKWGSQAKFEQYNSKHGAAVDSQVKRSNEVFLQIRN